MVSTKNTLTNSRFFFAQEAAALCRDRQEPLWRPCDEPLDRHRRSRSDLRISSADGLGELLEPTQLRHLEVGPVDITFVVEKDVNFAVAFESGDRINAILFPFYQPLVFDRCSVCGAAKPKAVSVKCADRISHLERMQRSPCHHLNRPKTRCRQSLAHSPLVAGRTMQLCMAC